MNGVVAVSAFPIAVAFVVGVGGFAALLPFLIADESRWRSGEAHLGDPVRSPVRSTVVASQLSMEPSPLNRPVAAPAMPRVSRLRLVATVGALVVWSVWSVRRPLDRGRHD